ncbi:hypothetical protein TNCV_4502881 [Trichonephila clavipes]|nr:hypothetical protein TNCV_4502881 [Trichonephila clavipes]
MVRVALVASLMLYMTLKVSLSRANVFRQMTFETGDSKECGYVHCSLHSLADKVIFFLGMRVRLANQNSRLER